VFTALNNNVISRSNFLLTLREIKIFPNRHKDLERMK